MAAMTAPAAAPLIVHHSKAGWAVVDGLTVTWRNLKAMSRTPEVIVFATIQPIIFVLTFRYVFGGAIDVPGVDYVDFLMPGMFVQTVVFGAMNTGIGLSEDLHKGLIERFRSLPMARSAVLAGRSARRPRPQRLRRADDDRRGFAVGFDFTTAGSRCSPRSLLLLLFGFAFAWIFALIGLAAANVRGGAGGVVPDPGHPRVRVDGVRPGREHAGLAPGLQRRAARCRWPSRRCGRCASAARRSCPCSSAGRLLVPARHRSAVVRPAHRRPASTGRVAPVASRAPWRPRRADPQKLLEHWMEWERGETTAGPRAGQPEDRRAARRARAARRRRPAPNAGGPDRLTVRGGPQFIPRPAAPRRRPARRGPSCRRRSAAIGLDALRRAFTGRVGAPSDGRGPRGRPAVGRPRRASGSTRANRGAAHPPQPGAAVAPRRGRLPRRPRRPRRGAGRRRAARGGRGGRPRPGDGEVLGELDHLMTVTSRSFIVPFVGAAARATRRARRRTRPRSTPCCSCPVDELLLDEVYREERWNWARRRGTRAPGIDFFFELVGDTVWGATAAMLRQLLGLALGLDAASTTDETGRADLDEFRSGRARAGRVVRPLPRARRRGARCGPTSSPDGCGPSCRRRHPATGEPWSDDRRRPRPCRRAGAGRTGSRRGSWRTSPATAARRPCSASS